MATEPVRFVCAECAQDSINWGTVPPCVSAEDFDRLESEHATELAALRARVAELEAQLLEHSDVCKEGPRPLTQQARDAAHYYELLYAVGKKYPGETRHETALRYIQQAEAESDDRAASNKPAQRKETDND